MSDSRESIQYREYQPGDESRAVNAFNEVFQHNRDTAYWRWKFLQQPGPLALFAVDANNRVRSQMAGYRTQWCGAGRRLPVAQVADVFTRREPDLIRRRVMLRTITAFHRKLVADGDVKLVFGFPSPALAGLHGVYQSLQPGEKAMMTCFRDPHLQTSEHATLQVSTDIPSRQQVNALWLRVSQRYGLCTPRDWSWLSWRFLSRPDVRNYQFYGCFDAHGSLVAWTVLRPVSCTLWICDLVWDGTSREALFALDAAAADQARRHQLPRLGIRLQGDPQTLSLLTERGWSKPGATPELRPKMHIYDPDLDVDLIRRRLYLSYADSDLV